MIPNDIIPSEPMRNAVTKTSEFVLVPKAAIDWLNGAGPDADGNWFGDEPADARGRGAYWWRRKFAALIAAAPEPQPEVAAEPVVAAAMNAFVANVRQQDPQWDSEDGEEGEILLTSPEGDYFALEYAIRDALKAAVLATPPVVEEAVKAEPVAWVGDYKKSDGTTDYFVMLGHGDRQMSLHCHSIRGRAEYEAAEINHSLTGSAKPEFEDFDLDPPPARSATP